MVSSQQNIQIEATSSRLQPEEGYVALAAGRTECTVCGTLVLWAELDELARKTGTVVCIKCQRALMRGAAILENARDKAVEELKVSPNSDDSRGLLQELRAAQDRAEERTIWLNDPTNFIKRDDGVWCRRTDSGDLPVIPDAQLLPDRTWREWVLYQHHNTPIGGHPGASLMTHRIKEANHRKGCREVGAEMPKMPEVPFGT